MAQKRLQLNIVFSEAEYKKIGKEYKSFIAKTKNLKIPSLTAWVKGRLLKCL